MDTIKKVSLAKQEGKSDKEYHLQLVLVEGGYRVMAQNGRRGSTMTQREITNKELPPLSLTDADKVYESKLKEKLRDRYVEMGEAASGHTLSGVAGKSFQQMPQLLNKIDAENVDEYIEDDDYFGMEKMDGERRMTSVKDTIVIGGNKLGFIVDLKQQIADALIGLGVNIVSDGEDMSTQLHLFDLIELNGEDMRGKGALARYKALNEVIVQGDIIKVVKIAETTEEKRALFNEVKARNGEGLVFKRKDSPYVEGRPNKGGDQVKHPFREVASCFVTGWHSSKRSVSLGMIDEHGNSVDVGNLTIAEKYAMPEMDSVVDVDYLYAYRNGSIYQPVFKSVRNDVLKQECLTSQLKYKNENVLI